MIQYIGPSKGGISNHGYTTDVLASALQKYIRRGHFHKALYVAVQLMEFDTILAAKGLVTRTLNRLRVILFEDIGVANPGLLPIFHKYYIRLNEKRDDFKTLEKIIWLFARSPKSRLCSDIKAMYFVDDNWKKIYNTDDVLDIEDEIEYKFQEGDGKRVRRWALGVLSGLCKKTMHVFYWVNKMYVNKDVEVATRYRSKNPINLLFEILFAYSEDDKRLKKNLEICFEYWKFFKNHRDSMIFVIYPVLLCIKNTNWDIDNTIPDDLDAWEKERDNKRKIDSYCYDVHTVEGKKAGMDAKDFALQGALVKNEDMTLFDPVFRRMYLTSKNINKNKIDEYFDKYYPNITEKKKVGKSEKKLKFDGTLIDIDKDTYESDVFKDVLFANVSMKMNTYFTTFRGENVLVKGPYTNDSWKYSLFVDELKPLFGLNKIGINRIMLRHDIGTKGKFEKGKRYLFLICRDFGPGISKYPRIKYSGKAMQNIERMDKENIPIPQLVTWLKSHDLGDYPEVLEEYCKILLFRQMIQTSDTNNTNIIINRKDLRLLSLDENLAKEFRKELFSHSTQKKIIDIVTDELRDKKYRKMLKSWKDILDGLPESEFVKMFQKNLEKMTK